MNLNPAVVSAPEGRVSPNGLRVSGYAGKRGRCGGGRALCLYALTPLPAYPPHPRPSSAAAPPEEQHQRRSPTTLSFSSFGNFVSRFPNG
jgi:hypothetical protein